jgi:hypothetical protein
LALAVRQSFTNHVCSRFRSRHPRDESLSRRLVLSFRWIAVLACGAALMVPVAAQAATNGMIVGSGGTGFDYYDLYAVNPDGSDEQFLFPSRSPRGSGQTFSADGNQLVFVRFAENEQSKVFISSLNDVAERPIVTDGSRPAWSPDGRQIAYVRFDDSEVFDTIRIVGTDGSGDHAVLQEDWSCGSDGLWWSPATFRIMYFCGTGNNMSLVSVMPDGTGRTETPLPSELRTPALSPDGSTFAALRKNVSGTFDVVTWPAGSAQPPRLVAVFPGEFAAGLAWSPDATQLAASTYDGVIHVTDFSGSPPGSIAAGFLYELAWQPCVAGVTITCRALKLPYVPPPPAPAPPPAPSGPGPFDGVASIKARSAKQTRSDRVRLDVACDARSASVCHVKITLVVAEARKGVRKNASLGSLTGQVSAGRTVRFAIKLGASARAKLRKAKTLQTTVSVFSLRSDGSKRIVSAKVTLRSGSR